MIKRIRAHEIGPIKEADVRFGDLTIFVGPQATGKSIFLQLLKLLEDKQAIHQTMRKSGLVIKDQDDNFHSFFDLYLGEGMSSIWSKEKSRLFLGNSQKEVKISTLTHSRTPRVIPSEKMFYIPAQRVMSLRDGMPYPFSDFKAGDPFVLRDFGDKLHYIVQNEIGFNEKVFPRSQRLDKVLRGPIEEHIFGGFRLRTQTSRYHQSRLVLRARADAEHALPYLVWSAGQREFVPLLLGIYWLLPSSKVAKREKLEWVVIEEPEMGLHPNGIGAVINLILELRLRGYRICLSTHSSHVLDIVWAIQFLQKNGGSSGDIVKLLNLPSTQKTKDLATCSLKSKFKTYYFKRDGKVCDISNLDPGSKNVAEEGWGGLTEFSGRVGDVVAEVAGKGLSKGL